MNTRNKFVTAMCAVLALFTLFSAYASAASTSTVRLGGADRYQTAAKISASGWDDADTVVLASSTGFADALAGVPLAYALDAPILLLDGKTVNSHTLAEIRRLGADSVYILGGTASISADTESRLATEGFAVTRVSGSTRFETAEKIANVMYDMGAVKSDTAFFAYAYNYPDALAAGSVAAMNGSPILYAPASGKISDGAASCLDKLGIRNAVVLGGTAAIGDDVASDVLAHGVSVERIGGFNRYETGLNIANHYSDAFSGDSVCFATGKNYPDALAGGVFAAKMSAPVVLIDEKIDTGSINRFVGSLSPDTAYIFGGTAVISDSLVNSCLGNGTTTTTPTITSTAPTTTTTSTTAPTPATKYYSGHYKVGSDIPAGDYVLYCTDDIFAYMAISSSSNSDDLDSIIENDIFKGQLYITVSNGQYLEIDGAYALSAQRAPAAKPIGGKLSDGMYKVGHDIPSGEYKLICTDEYYGYCAIYDHPIGGGEILTNDIFTDTLYVSVSSSQYLYLSGAELVADQ